MRDPHVVWVRYRLEADPHVTFENPPPIEWETDTFRMRLAEGIATFEMREHFPSVQEARNAVEVLLRSWEIDTGLRYGTREIHFRYEDSKLIDRNPPPPGTVQVVTASATLRAYWALTAIAHVRRKAYPQPPQHFRVSPDVETMWHRYEGYVEGREPISSMAYFCLTVLEARAGNRVRAAREYGISKNVLGELGKLTSERGDAKSARKMSPRLRPLTSKEATWIEAVVKAIIRRVGERKAKTPLPTIMMKDLPSLD